MATPNLRVSAADRRLQIAEAATELFARQGFEGTTTRQIAERAGVNEALIFRYFTSKEDLYWAVIDEKIRASGGAQRLHERLRSGVGDVEVFADLAEKMLRRDGTLTRLLLFSALENHRLSQRLFRTYMAQYYETLAEHIRKGSQEGRLRDVDPMLAARGFLGMVFYHFMIRELFGGGQQFESAQVGRTLAEIFVHGMLPGNGKPGLRKSRKKSENGSE